MTTKNQVTIIGCGHIGTLVAQQHLKQGDDVLGVVQHSQSAEQLQQLGIQSLVLDLDGPLDALPSLAGHRVYYFAPPPRDGIVDARLQAFLKMLEQRQQQPEKILLISTSGVYGDCKGNWVTETTVPQASQPRSLRRLSAEQLLQAYTRHQHVPWIILRVPGIYGPGRLPLARIEQGNPVVRQEDSPWSNRIHAADLANLCQLSMQSDLTGIFNVGDEQPSTMYDYFMQVADAAGLARPPAITLVEAEQKLSEGMLSYMRESRRIDSSKLRNALGYELKYPTLADGLKAIFS